jgi:hypothetical protein
MHPPIVNPGDRDVCTFPREFFIDYVPVKGGSGLKEVEKVRIGRKGDQSYERTETVERMMRGENQEWRVFKPYYDHWKQGSAAPLNGTPLAAFPGATPQLVKALEAFHIKTVEDGANLNDDTMTRVNLPGLRRFKQDCKAYLDAKASTSIVAGEIAELRDENAKLKQQMQALLERLDEDKPKRGRPPKVANEPAHHSQ